MEFLYIDADYHDEEPDTTGLETCDDCGSVLYSQLESRSDYQSELVWYCPKCD